jgi:type I restriction enzyme R subunit
MLIADILSAYDGLIDILVNPDLKPQEIQKIKKVAKELLKTVKENLKYLYKFQDKEPTRDAVKVLIRNFLWDEKTGLPVDCYTQNDVDKKNEAVFYHVYRTYPTVPSPYYASVGN